MIRRAVLNAVGYMDETAFPIGYGEENDFCIRAQDAGFSLAFADDTYVYHAKSKSFGTKQRVALSEAGTEAIKEKHGAEKFNSLLERVARRDKMDHVRHNIRVALTQDAATPVTSAKHLITAQRVLFILPVRGGGGGAHSVVQEVAAMRKLGVEAKIAVHRGDLDDFLHLYSDINDTSALFTPFTPESLKFVAGGYDIVVATIYSSVEMLASLVENMPWILPAYYAQDYEPFFYDEADPEWQEACDSYTRIPGMFVFAKTAWICDTITQRHGVRVHKVEPSIDHLVYALTGPSVANADSTKTITAMIRPSTPRRGAARTMELLTRLKKQFNEDVTIRVFGCDDDDPPFQKISQGLPLINHGVLSRPEVAALLRSTDIFVDLSDYQAFGRTGLEAMACGALAVVPQAGGASEYADDGINAVCVDTLDVNACVTRISQILNAPEQLATMQLRGIETASRYSPRRAALSELSAMALALGTWRVTHPLPVDRPRLLLLPDPEKTKSSALPGEGNERLPRPYKRTDFGARWDVIAASNGARSTCKGGDIAILKNNARATIGRDFEGWLHNWKHDGGRLIYDLNGDAIPLPVLDLALADAADVITVSDAVQRDLVIQTQPHAAYKVMEIPSYLDADTWQADTPDLSENAPLRIGYFGSPSCLNDIEALNPALRTVQNKHGVEVKIVGAYEGADPVEGQRVSYPKMYHQPHMQQRDFIHWLSKVAKWDIVLLPDQGPLRLKFWQASALQGAIICRDAPDLFDCANHAENCLMVGDDPAEWEAALTRLIENKDLRRSLASASRKDACEKWTIQANKELYEKVLEKAVNGIKHIA